jgi:photosystem II stability/assembly factor-like uncharacterized protein
MAVDPSRPATVYAATGGSGVFKSCDAGQSWIPAPTNMPDRTITALAPDPASPGVLYAATRSGLLKSVTGGATWDVLSSVVPPVRSIAIDPRRPATIYAGTERHGFFKSVDGGRQWTLTDFGMPAGAIIQSIAIDPGDSNILYAGTDAAVGSRAQVFKTSDGGQHWEESWMPASSGVVVQSVYALVVDPKKPSTIYAGTINPDRGGNSNQAGVFKSPDGGKTWVGLPGIWGPDHRYIRSVVIDPFNTSNVYATSISGDFWRSTDAGMTAATASFTNGSLSLAIDPVNPSTLYMGTSSGKEIFKSTDGGLTWRQLAVQ